MKHVAYRLFFCLLITLPIIAIDPHNTDATDEVNTIAQKPHCSKQEIAQAVLSGVAHVASNVGSIIKDPHNHQNVGGSVASMIAGIINIIAASIKNRTIDFTDEDAVRQHLIDICQPICDQITDAVVTKTRNKENNYQ